MQASADGNYPFTVPIPEACRLSGIGRSTLYELIGDGTIKTKKVGRRRLVIVESLRDFLQNDHS